MHSPVAQFLYDLGLCNEEDPITDIILKRDPALKDKHDAFVNPTPKYLTMQQHTRQAIAASRAAKVDYVHPTSDNHSILKEYAICSDGMAMVYLSPDPYHFSFIEKLDPSWFSSKRNPMGGLNPIQDNDRLILKSMVKGTLAGP